VCILEFDVQAVCNQLTVRFVFGSEEYPEFVNSSFNDAFGFFVTGPNPAGGNYNAFNIARLPNGTIASIDNINAGNNAGFYVNNTGTTIEYDGITTAISYTINLTPCATYHFKLAIGDAGDCSYDSGVFIDFISCSIPPVTLTPSSTPTGCAGNTGTATATATGGVGPFSYSWNTTPVQTTSTATGLAAGTYTCTVTDLGLPCGTPQTTTATVGSSGSAPTISVTPTASTICNGGNVSLTASGGTSYTWSPAAGLSATTGATVTASPSTTTTYTVTGTGACGTGTATSTITVNPIPTTTAGSNSPICAGSALNLTATTSAGATYAWSGPNGFTSALQNPTIASATTAASGTYTVTVTANGCSSTSTVNVTVNAIPTTTAGSNSPICAGTNLNLTATTAAGATYAWSGPNGFTSALQNPTIASATTAASGTYTVTVTANGCSSTSTVNVTVNAAPTTTAGSNSPICTGTDLNLTATTAAGATYAWSGPNGFTSALQNPTIVSATPGESGTYTVTVSANGCSTTSTVTVSVNSTFDATITVVGPFCVNDPSITLTAVDGGGTWSGPGITNATSGTFDPSTAGVGTVTIQYLIPGSCGDTATTTITMTGTADASITPAGPFCNTAAAVTLSAATPGGTWSGTGITNATTGTFDPAIAGAGSHTITYTIAGACGDTQTTTIVVTTQLDATITPAGPFCASNANTFLAAVDPGGIWSGPGIVNATTGEFSPTNAGAGTHTITYTISGSCGDVQTTSILVIADANATITPAGPFCIADPVFTLTAAQTGGTWSGNGITNAATGTFDPATAGVGTHTVTYTISGVCGDVGTLDILVYAQANTTITAVNPMCTDAAAITLNAATPGGTWSGTGITNAATGTFDPSVAGAGTHTITYTISGSCGNTSTTNITVNPLPVISFSLDVNSGCIPVASTFSNTTPNANSCTWAINGNTVSSNCGGFAQTFNVAGCYDVTLTTTDNSGCTSSSTINSMVCAYDIPVADFSYSPLQTNVLDPVIDFTNLSSGATNYQWVIANVDSTTTINPSYTFPDTSAGNYEVCLWAYNTNGCVDSTCQIITIYDEFLLYVPNAFTPDADGKNEIFLPIVKGLDPMEYELLIFNRWGELVYNTQRIDGGWDGTYKGQKAKQDVYVWKIKGKKTENGERVVYYGHVTLLK
jgi:gliding motility-associated-like protein